MKRAQAEPSVGSLFLKRRNEFADHADDVYLRFDVLGELHGGTSLYDSGGRTEADSARGRWDGKLGRRGRPLSNSSARGVIFKNKASFFVLWPEFAAQNN